MAFSPVADGSPVRLVLPAVERSVPRVRYAVEETLRKWDLGEYIDEAVLIGSELATNAIKVVVREQEERRADYGVAILPAQGLCIHVWIYISRDELFIAVWDVSDLPPVMVPETDLDDPEAEIAESGRGLFLVDQVAVAWGWVPAAEGGKYVWARCN